MGIMVVATNRKANHNYKIIDKYESGIVLTGSEVKSIRNNKISMVDLGKIVKASTREKGKKQNGFRSGMS